MSNEVQLDKQPMKDDENTTEELPLGTRHVHPSHDPSSSVPVLGYSPLHP